MKNVNTIPLRVSSLIFHRVMNAPYLTSIVRMASTITLPSRMSWYWPW